MQKESCEEDRSDHLAGDVARRSTCLGRDGVRGVTITQVLGHGAQKGITQQWKGNVYTIDLIQKVELKTIVPADRVDAVLYAIREYASTALLGDGKVFVTDVADAIRVRSGERGEGAV